MCNIRKPLRQAATGAVVVVALALSLAGTARGALVGQWKFDGDLADSFGASDGTAIGDATAGTNNGISGGAVSFDGTDDAVRISQSVISGGSFTIAFWEFSPSGTNQGYFIGAGAGGGAGDIFLRRIGTQDHYAGGITQTSPPYTFGEPGPFARGQWHFNVVTHTGSNVGSWYVDGNLIASQPTTFPATGLRDHLYVGNRGDVQRDFDGRIDDLQIYNAPVRPAMVQALMDNPGKTLNEVFVPVLDNASFEQPRLTHSTSTGLDAANYVAADPASWSRGWSDSSTGTSNSVYHLRPGGETGSGLKSNGGYFYDMTDGDQGVGLILRSGSITESWVFQSLGTITAEDIGLTFMATVDTSVRYQGGLLFNGERGISFRSGVTEGRNGSFGVLESMDLSSATRIATSDDPFTTLTELFRPTPADIGKEIFLVVSVYDATPAGGSDQYQFDNVTLSVVPEPATWMLAAVGLAGVLAVGRRRRKGQSER